VDESIARWFSQHIRSLEVRNRAGDHCAACGPASMMPPPPRSCGPDRAVATDAADSAPESASEFADSGVLCIAVSPSAAVAIGYQKTSCDHFARETMSVSDALKSLPVDMRHSSSDADKSAATHEDLHMKADSG
jgi:hypothetical protein